MKRTVVSSSSSSKKSDSDGDSIMTSENYEDSEDEANPLNRHMDKPARGVKFANTLEAGDEPGYHSGPAS